MRTAEVLQGNSDDGHNQREIDEGIQLLHDYANVGRQLDDLTLTDVGRVAPGPDETLYGRRRMVTLPAGYLTVSRSYVPPLGSESPATPGSDNHIG
jgi:hypothetical protein